MKTNDFNKLRKPYTSPTMKVVLIELGSLMETSVTGGDQPSEGEWDHAPVFRGLFDDDDLEELEMEGIEIY